jgi:hypothetical protein
MSSLRLWDRCINHRGADTQRFVADYFSDSDRRTLLIAGVGFDPRSTSVCEMLHAVMDSRLTGLFIREERPDPARELVKRAARNYDQMTELLPGFREMTVEVFAPDGAVIGGRNAVRVVHELSLNEFTDVIVDFSALSIGVAFPLVRLLFDRVRAGGESFNLHLMVTDEPLTDDQIFPTACDIVETIHGFKGGFGLFDNTRAARLWLPQLIRGRNTVLDKIHSYFRPHDVCPVLPFPASHPRLVDELIEQYSSEFESTWGVDTRNIVYADEKKPLDLYRTILRIDDARRPVFEGTGGSMIVLSPIGSKVLAIGALMAALERDFPVAHVEAIAYTVDFKKMDSLRTGCGEVVHTWLYGDAYTDTALSEVKNHEGPTV